jgi:dihydroorotase
MTPQELTFPRPDDMHLHVRDGAAMQSVVPLTARQFARAIIMPNLRPPVTTVAQAGEYLRRILAVFPEESPKIMGKFTPLMTLYLTDNTSPEEIRRAKESGFVHAVKYYPAGATTNSDSGVTALEKVDAVLSEMEKQGFPLLLHGEVTDAEIDIFDREAKFVDTHLQTLRTRYPALRMVVEHITTEEAAQFVMSAPAHIAATITPQHMLYNRNAIFKGGIRPHYYCLPILKREHDRKALIAAATSGSPKFFLGTDSAPHAKHNKENCCGHAGCFTAHAALELYASVFEHANALEKLPDFAAKFGAQFYGLPINAGTVTLRKESWKPSETFALGAEEVVPMDASETLAWKLIS